MLRNPSQNRRSSMRNTHDRIFNLTEQHLEVYISIHTLYTDLYKKGLLFFNLLHTTPRGPKSNSVYRVLFVIMYFLVSPFFSFNGKF